MTIDEAYEDIRLHIEDPGHYVPSNYQDILIEFGTVDDLN